MQLKEALSGAVSQLTANNVPSPRMNAELLLMFTLGCDRAYLFAHPERKLSSEERSGYESALAQRSVGMPAQYITGHQEFWGMDLIVSPAVLIPRPETEHIVETVLESSRADTRENTHPHQTRIVDVGTGSGCIALALARELPHAEIHATDISPAALEIARANAARLRLEHRIRFQEADLLNGLKGKFDVVVSNPPYVGESEKDTVQLEVRKFEPRTAVFAGPNGTEVIERLIPEALNVLRVGGLLVMEISGTIVERVRALMKDWEKLEVIPDLQSIPRVVRARKPRT